MEQQSKPLYQPTHVVDSSTYDPMRGSIRTKQVHYILYNGNKSYIEIPADDYSAELVRELLEHAAAKHVEVMSLQGPMVNGGQVQPTNPWLNTGT